ncbi:MAG: hypothetical protein JKY29_01605 [Gammaproteobacteria bacterium]|nr:hypothetical protein [Gammaproteobacteria bacterium]
MRKIVFFITLVCLAVPVGAAEDNLKNIMQGLGHNFAQIVDALLVGDREQLVQAAGKIAQHPEIPAYQRILIAEELGEKIAQFAQFDQVVHSLSLGLQETGLVATEAELLASTQEMLTACLSCHTAYKGRISPILE